MYWAIIHSFIHSTFSWVSLTCLQSATGHTGKRGQNKLTKSKIIIIVIIMWFWCSLEAWGYLPREDILLQLFLEGHIGISWVGGPAGEGKGIPGTEVRNSIPLVVKWGGYGKGHIVGADVDRARWWQAFYTMLRIYILFPRSLGPLENWKGVIWLNVYFGRIILAVMWRM